MSRPEPRAALSRCRVALAVLALFTGGCIAQPSGGPFAEAWPALRERADSLLAAGQVDAAVAVIGSARATVRAPWAPAWQLRELAASEREHAWLARTRGSARDSLVAAAAAVRAALRASQADSIASGQRSAADAYGRRLAVLGPRSSTTARAALELADLSFRLSRTALTDSLAQDAGDVLAAAFGPLHPDVALARELLGRSIKNYQGRSGRARALALYQDALRIRIQTLGPHAPGIAGVFHEIGNLERTSGRPAAALDALRMALLLRREAFGPVHDAVASTLTAMAIVEGARNHWAVAESLAAGAIAASPPGEGTPPMSRAFRLGVWGQLLRHEGHPAQAVAALREAVALNEQAWALTPRDEGSTIQSGLSLHSDLALALAALGLNVEALAMLERGTSRTLLERSGDPGPEPTGEWLARLQRQLAPDEAMVSWVRTRFGALGADDPAWAVVVRAQGPPQWLALPLTAQRAPGGARLRDLYWTELRSAAAWPVRLSGGEREAALARAMGAAWFEPLEPALTGVRRLVVFSPELCAGGPLEALGDRTGAWLADRFDVTYAPSATLYARAREHARRWRRSSPALVVGDPDYANGAWARLAGSGEEIAAVTATFPATRVLVRAGATAPALRAQVAHDAGGRFRLLHLATHATVDASHLLESQLVLAPDRSDETDSRLSAREIATDWRLDADLVFLTGCRSASGVSAAAEGWLGFQYAFLRAGARSVLVSLWPVDDAAAALLVREFYARLRTSDPLGSRAAALEGARRAVREWRNAAGERPFAHPAYWAGFALIGDPGP